MSLYSRQSPYKVPSRPASGQKQYSDYKQSPVKSALQETTSGWQNRYKDLERSYNNTGSEMDLQNKYKQDNNKELEKKIDMVLQHNAQLLNENNNLQKQFNSRKTESEIWKNKYESIMSDNLRLKAEHEMELKRLSSLSQNQQEHIDQVEIERFRELEQQKSQADIKYQMNQQQYKQQHCEEIGLYEEQLKKLREILQDREKELAYANTSIEKIRSDSKLDIMKIQEEKEKLNEKMALQEVQSQEKIQEMEFRIGRHSEDTLYNLKSMKENEKQILESEIGRIRDLLELKNNEIQSLIQQNQDLINNFQDEENSLRSEVSNLKNLVAQLNSGKSDEIEMQQRNLQVHHDSEIQGLRFHHENQVESLQNEVNNLQDILRQKTDEIQQQINEKLKQRQDYSQEVVRLNSLVEQLAHSHGQKEDDIKQKHDDHEEHKKRLQRGHTQLLEKKQTQMYDQEQEQQRLQSVIQQKEDEMQEQENHFKQQEEQYHADIENLQQQVQEQEQRFDSMVEEKGQQFEIRVEQARQAEEDLKQGIENQKQQYQTCNQELERTRIQLQKKIEEYDNLDVYREKLESTMKEREHQIEKLEEDLDFTKKQSEQEKNDIIANLNGNHQNEVNALNNQHYAEVSELQNQLQSTLSELATLQEQYKLQEVKCNELQTAIDELEVHAEKLQSYEQKISSLSQQIVNSKNLYGNIVKTKARYGSPEKNQYIA